MAVAALPGATVPPVVVTFPVEPFPERVAFAKTWTLPVSAAFTARVPALTTVWPV